MKPIVIPGHTRTLAKNQDEYNVLAILDHKTDGADCMTSAWEPSPEDIESLQRGGVVLLTVLGTVHPPVMLQVTDPGD